MVQMDNDVLSSQAPLSSLEALEKIIKLMKEGKNFKMELVSRKTQHVPRWWELFTFKEGM